MAQSVACPFCGYSSLRQEVIQLHIEEHHTEDSPFVVNERPSLPPRPSSSRDASSGGNSTSSREENPWIKCTRPDCGEYIAIAELDEHYRFHEDIKQLQLDRASPERNSKPSSSVSGRSKRVDQSKSPRKLQRDQPSSSPSSPAQTPRQRSILEWIKGTSNVSQARPQRRRIVVPRQPGRLGRKELGPHAYEKRMPDSVRDALIHGAEPYRRIDSEGRRSREIYVDNETRGVIPVLADLCNVDSTTTATYLCHPSTRHVVKIRCDGNFCGYWNIQMMLSYLYSQEQGLSSSSRNTRNRLIPNILDIQDDIERAWDAGICSYGRVETGGIRGTRKWIGTHEALAYFTQVGVEVEALSFRQDEGDSASQPGVLALLDHIEAYFMGAMESPQTRHHRTSHITPLPPIYFQRFGHSTTIVGLERKANGERNLLVFDPSFATTPAMGRLLAGRNAWAYPNTILRAYRRSDLGLSRWDEFEIIVPKISSIPC